MARPFNWNTATANSLLNQHGFKIFESKRYKQELKLDHISPSDVKLRPEVIAKLLWLNGKMTND